MNRVPGRAWWIVATVLVIKLSGCAGSDPAPTEPDDPAAVTATYVAAREQVLARSRATATPDAPRAATQATTSTTVIASAASPSTVMTPTSVATRAPRSSTPAATPTPFVVTTVPQPGAVLYESDLLDQPTGSVPGAGEAFIADGTYHLRAVPTELNNLYSFLEFPERRAMHVSVDVQLLATGADADACLELGVDPAMSQRYALCVTSTNEVYATYDEAAPGPVLEWIPVQTLLPLQAPPELRPVGDWNTLTIIVDETAFWFLVNDALVGQARSDGAWGTRMLLSVFSYDGQPAEAAFTAFVIQALQ